MYKYIVLPTFLRARSLYTTRVRLPHAGVEKSLVVSVCFVVERLKAHLSCALGVDAPSHANEPIIALCTSENNILLFRPFGKTGREDRAQVQRDVNCAYIMYICIYSTEISLKGIIIIFFFAPITQDRIDLG